MIKNSGGMTVAQSEDSCVVSGMPRAAILKGYANKIVPLDGMGAFLVGQFHSERTHAERADKSETNDRAEKNDKGEKNERTPVSSQRT
jgi:hypothetical protein